MRELVAMVQAPLEVMTGSAKFKEAQVLIDWFAGGCSWKYPTIKFSCRVSFSSRWQWMRVVQGYSGRGKMEKHGQSQDLG